MVYFIFSVLNKVVFLGVRNLVGGFPCWLFSLKLTYGLVVFRRYVNTENNQPVSWFQG
jgi:hypothetical protein